MSVTNSSLAVAERAQDSPKEGTIDTRFGRFEVDFDKAIRIPRGIIGFETAYSFILLDVPGESIQAFKLLQSLDDPALGFIVLPLSPQDDAIAGNDHAVEDRAPQVDPLAGDDLRELLMRPVDTAAIQREIDDLVTHQADLGCDLGHQGLVKVLALE